MAQSLSHNLSDDYHHWNGRYTSNVLIFNNPLYLNGLMAYRAAPIVLLLLSMVAMNCLLKVVCDKIYRWKKWVISASFVIIYLSTMPILSEGLFWYTGAYTYLLSCVLVIFYSAWLLKYSKSEFLFGRTLDVIILSLFVLITCGFCEVTTLILTWSHVLVFIFLIKKKQYKWFLPLLIFCVLGFLIMATAPGNEERAAHFQHKYDLWLSAKMTVVQSGRFILTWILNPVFWIGLASIPMFYSYIRNESLNKLRIPFGYGFLILVLIMTSCIFPAYWGTGILGQHRTVNVAYFFFLVWSVMMVISAINLKRINTDRFARKGLMKYWPSVLTLSVFMAPNYRQVTIDWLSGDMARFDADMMTRYEEIRNCPENCVLTQIETQPKSIFLYEISSNHKYFVNEGWACYFDKKTVSLDR